MDRLTGSFDSREIHCFKEGQSCYVGLQMLDENLPDDDDDIYICTL